MSFIDYINETYMAPYFTGKGTPVIPPRHADNRWLNKERLLRRITALETSSYDSLYLSYPTVIQASRRCFTLPILTKHEGCPVSVALRVHDGKWLTNRGDKTDKFSIMSYDKAHELMVYHSAVDYVLIEWATVRLSMFMVSKIAFDRMPVEEILQVDITPRHITVAREVQRVLGRDWCFADCLTGGN